MVVITVTSAREKALDHGALLGVHQDLAVMIDLQVMTDHHLGTVIDQKSILTITLDHQVGGPAVEKVVKEVVLRLLKEAVLQLPREAALQVETEAEHLVDREVVLQVEIEVVHIVKKGVVHQARVEVVRQVPEQQDLTV